MKTISLPGMEEVSTETKTLFESIIHHLGKLPNLYATIGYSAVALQGFLEFEQTLSKGSFNRKEREAIALIISEVNGCDYCLAAHSMAAMLNGFTKEQTFNIRRAATGQPKLDAILQLARSIAINKGKADQLLLDAFFAAGFNEAALMELIGLIAVRTFTNYVFAITNIPIDFPAAAPLADSQVLS
jgi:uncharacterized peroxidase-related enzyme